ncbi:DUF3243 domain-containing protein [Gorillibacterium sp. sgz500922]|uniref:DUF3243 domain-containing protein n=1 Tax=Gorillibacterium sp. sgz500922 TaxID=3446694 RepID=UPI003F67AA3D
MEQNHAISKDGELNVQKIDNVVDRIGEDRKDEILSDFEGFKSYLAKRIKLGEGIGLGEEQLALAAEKVADYLAAKEAPRNSEERLLHQLWKVGEKDERHALAHMLVRLAQEK